MFPWEEDKKKRRKTRNTINLEMMINTEIKRSQIQSKTSRTANFDNSGIKLKHS
jgi:hypothetical protein